jgi:hypothetical protein
MRYVAHNGVPRLIIGRAATTRRMSGSATSASRSRSKFSHPNRNNWWLLLLTHCRHNRAVQALVGGNPALLVSATMCAHDCRQCSPRASQIRCTACGTNKPIAMNAMPMMPMPPASQANIVMPVMTAAEHSTMPIWKAAEAIS